MTIRIIFNVFQNFTNRWGYSRKKKKNETKCNVCGLDLPTPERLERHLKKAHGNVPAKKLDPGSSEGGGLW